MRALDRKLLRELWRLRGQLLAIALVIGSGVATYVISHSVVDSLRTTRAAFYEDTAFADVFVTLKRAPDAVGLRLAGIPGVQRLETRVTTRALLDIEGFTDPVSAQVLSLPQPDGLNRLYLRAGRLPESAREVAINEAFADAQDLKPGSRLQANLNGRQQRLTVTAVVLSPEFVYYMRPGDVFPDYKRHGVLWMSREPLAAAAGLQQSFNDVTLRLAAGASTPSVIEALDRLLAPWGGAGAIGRDDHLSHRYLADEIRQNETMATVVPVIFLSVAAFLLNVVLSRLMSQERAQISVLKAFGYSNGAIVWHYLKLVGLVVLAGSVIGILAGARIGMGQAALYGEFYRFPFLHYVLRPQVALAGVVVSAAAALAGTLVAVMRSARLPPAAGMRPEPPPRFRRGVFDRGPLRSLFSPPARMVARNIARRPMKSALTVLGIALAAAVLVVGGFMWGAIDFMLDVQFGQAHRADLTVTFSEITGRRAVHALQALPGVRRVEPFRAAPVRLRAGHRQERLGLQGLVPDAQLHRTLNDRFAPIRLEGGGLLLTDHLASGLGLAPGQAVQVQLLEGRRTTRALTVGGRVGELVGQNAYMNLDALNDWLGDGDVVSGAFLQVDADALDAVYARLKDMPRVVGVMNGKVARKSFLDSMGENLLIFAFINLCLAATIAVGVVYNSMRTALSERAHELASLRVLGYTRTEASYVLLGEIVVLTLIAIPVGQGIGYAFCAMLAESLASDLYRVPVALTPRTYAHAAVVVLAATVLSSLVMVRHIRRLSLVSALKVPQ